MSSYLGTAIHPETGKPTPAWFLDDYFGPHRYGVQFKDEYRVWRPEEAPEIVPALRQGDGM